MMYKILQGSNTAGGTVLQKRCSRICGLNPGLIYLQKVSKNSFLKLDFLKDIIQGFWLQLITIIAWNRQLTEHLS